MEKANEVVASLSGKARDVLRDLDPDMFDGGKLPKGVPGPIMAALRRRDVVAASPHRYLTGFGQKVVEEVHRG